MRKFRLIEEYPGSPKLYEICILSDNGYEYYCKNDFHHKINNPQDYPKFWEPIIEKDYEILSLECIVNPNKGLIYTVKNGEIINSNEDNVNVSIENALNFWINTYKSWRIYSIKRLLDGEIFTIGDKVKFQGKDFNDISNITKIIIENNSIYICSSISQFSIRFIEKIKQPLFTTEDGVEIFEGDNIYMIDIQNNYRLLDNQKIFKKPNETGRYKFFSTKEKAEEYILMNKPCLSYRDIEEIIAKSFVIKIDLLVRIKDKIKKLNNKN